MRDIAMIGFGEAGQAFAAGFPRRVLAYDNEPDAARRDQLARAAASSGVEFCPNADVALAGAKIVFCLVTADRAIEAARTYAPLLPKGALWCDGNSCAPDSKRQSASLIGAGYVDMAVMSPVHPKGHHTPVLLSGPGSEAMAPWVDTLDMRARRIDGQTGSASTIKMLRSVMVKGLEALTAECFLAARKAGVQDEVLSSLVASSPEMDWLERAGYNLERMMEHGTRRAAEMREVVKTLSALDMPHEVTAAVADWHARIGALGLKGRGGGLDQRAQTLLDRL
ncbi:NAD(P)-dependent oxidoreductase [Thioclava kandeliae]|uniref:DUF1932 domain-containing protein n=1 Tax=Thioclava kandeliae TaxID=3070818 RepID=A0ABV1SLX5_9RHOB